MTAKSDARQLSAAQQASDDQQLDATGREVVGWMVALTSSSDSSDVAARFEKWLKADPCNAAAWSTMAGALGPLDILARSGLDSRSVLMRQQGHGPTRRRVVTGIVALGGLFGASSMLADRYVSLRDLMADHLTYTNQQKDVKLADGSVLTLGPRSAVNVDFGPSRRQVKLLDGQVFAAVEADRRPFEIEAGMASLSTTSGRFSLARLAEKSVVLCASGAGTLAHDDRRLASLATGDQVTVGYGKIDRRRVDVEAQVAWTKGVLVATDERLDDIIDRFRPYYPGFIRFDPGIAARRATAVLNLHEPSRSIAALARSLDYKAQSFGNLYISIEPVGA